MPHIVSSREGSAAILSFARPEVQNRFNRSTLEELDAALTAAETDASVRAVVITGSGSTFCCGGQIDGFPKDGTMVADGYSRAFIAVWRRMTLLSKPIVAVVNGTVAAGGMTWLAAADLAIAVPEATFSLPELVHGQFPMLAMATLVHSIPKKLLFDMVYNARLLTAEEALQHSLVNRVVEETALAAALHDQLGVLASRSPTAMALGRRAHGVMQSLGVDSALEYANTMLGQLLSTADAVEGWHAREAGRPAVWSGH